MKTKNIYTIGAIILIIIAVLVGFNMFSSSGSAPTQAEQDMADAMGISIEEVRNQTPEEHMEAMREIARERNRKALQHSSSSSEEVIEAENTLEVEAEVEVEAEANITSSTATEPAPEAKTIVLQSANWQFSPNTITAKQGQKLNLNLMGKEGNHGITIPGLGVSADMSQGANSTVSIPTDKPGTYEFFCNVPCGSGHSKMVGTIIIE